MQLDCGTVKDLCKYIYDEQIVWLNPHRTIWSIQHAVDGKMFNPRSHDNEIHIQVYEENNLRDVYLAIKICQGDFFSLSVRNINNETWSVWQHHTVPNNRLLLSYFYLNCFVWFGLGVFHRQLGYLSSFFLLLKLIFNV